MPPAIVSIWCFSGVDPLRSTAFTPARAVRSSKDTVLGAVADSSSHASVTRSPHVAAIGSAGDAVIRDGQLLAPPCVMPGVRVRRKIALYRSRSNTVQDGRRQNRRLHRPPNLYWYRWRFSSPWTLCEATNREEDALRESTGLGQDFQLAINVLG